MTRQFLTILAFALLFLFLIQLAGTLVESIYILDLLKTSMDEKALGVLFFFSPVLLLFFGKPAPRSLFWISFALLFLARGATPYLNTLGRMLVSGVGTSVALILMPLLLVESSGAENRGRWLAPAQGIALAIGLSVMLRTLNFTLDLSLTPEYGWVGWLLGVLLGASLASLAPRVLPETPVNAIETSGSTIERLRWGVTTRAVLGLFADIILVYFAFSSPGVIAHWTEGDYAVIVGAVSLVSLGWLFVSLISSAWATQIKPAVLFVWNLNFSFFLFGTILIHTVQFPASPGSPPEVIGSPRWYQQLPMWLMLINSPVIFVDFAFFARSIVAARPSPRQLAPGFLLGSGLLVVLVFMNIFSNVWGYVDPVSPFFRGKFWLPFVLAGGLLSILAPLHTPRTKPWPVKSSERLRLDHSGAATGLVWGPALGSIFLVTLVVAAFMGRPHASPLPKDSIRVMTYNIQQANDASGEKAYDRQLALIGEVDPDVLGLQESDSARISLGNNDYPRYFAGKLGYYLYYGPKTVTGTFGTALLSKYPLENGRTVFTYSDTDEIGTTEAEILIGGRRLTLFNVHPAGSGTAMLAFAESLLQRAGRTTDVIALGDYNLRESEEAYQLIADQYQNAWLAVYPAGIDEDGLDMSGDKRIDHIFVSQHHIVLDAVYLLPPESATDHPAHWAEVAW